jgi:hypothetical protein
VRRAAGIPFERIDKDDPALAVDGLSGLLPARTVLGADALVVSGDLFPERESGDLSLSGLAFELETDDVGPSTSQRAAAEFQRFAEKFHAFAVECQQRSISGAFRNV